MDEQLLREFLAEAEDLIEALYGHVAELRARRAEGRARRELIGRIFRHVHTIKGTATATGLRATGETAHEFETLLDSVRAGRVAVSADVLEAFEEAAGAIAASLSAVARGGPEPAPPAVLLERLRRLAAAHTPGPDAGGGAAAEVFNALPEEVARSLGEHERARLAEAVAEGAGLFVVAVEFPLATFDEEFRRLSEALAGSGEVITTLPGETASSPDRLAFRLLYATGDTRARVGALASPFGADVVELTPGAAKPSTADAASSQADLASSREAGGASPLTTPTVRVPLGELDEVIAAAHELSGEVSAALDLALSDAPGSGGELEARAARVRRRFVELGERLIGLRMVSVLPTFERAARAGAVAARAAGKEVDFEIEGGEVRLDKSLAERVADPLLHLLRNAVGHGIETPDERRRAGKPPRGRVRLEATAEGSRVLLRVTDDGRGIDAEEVARAAEASGIVSEAARVTEEQALRLIFRPGFSTATELSEMSGRGVGLDVVERAVEQAGGEIRVRSRRGEGTTFELRLPTTLALFEAYVVRCAGFTYCVGAGQVAEAGRVARADISREGAARFAPWRGERLPLVHLCALVGLPAREVEGDEASEAVHVLVTEGRVAVAVDGLEGRAEVLVRGLGRHATRWRGVVGATELGDGTAAPVLDLPSLFETFGGGG